MNKIFLLLSLILLMGSCYHINKEDVEVPEKLISIDEMAEILSQVQIAEAGFKVVRKKPNIKNLKPELYNKILTNHNIDLIQFKENLDYYQQDPSKMEVIYEKVLEKLRVTQDIIEKEIEEKKIQDSINSINDSIAVALNDSVSSLTGLKLNEIEK